MLCISLKGIVLSDDDQLEGEWRRVVNNPQNVIVSDSLKDILDPESFQIDNDGLNAPSIDVLIQFSDEIAISGYLLFFERSPSEVKLSFICERSEAVRVFLGKRVEQVRVYNESGDFDFSIEILKDDEIPTLSFEFDEIDKVRSVGNLIIKM